jgi:hypothetical protein
MLRGVDPSADAGVGVDSLSRYAREKSSPSPG